MCPLLPDCVTLLQDDDSETLSSESDVDDEKTAGHAPEEEDDFGSDEDF